MKLKKNTNHDHDKYITTSEFTKLTWGNFAARLTQANWESKVILLILEKRQIFMINKVLNKYVISNKSKPLLVENGTKFTNNWFKSFYWAKQFF